MRLLNALRAAAPNENYGLLVQIEAENAGFAADRLERVVREQAGKRSSISFPENDDDSLQEPVA